MKVMKLESNCSCVGKNNCALLAEVVVDVVVEAATTMMFTSVGTTTIMRELNFFFYGFASCENVEYLCVTMRIIFQRRGNLIPREFNISENVELNSCQTPACQMVYLKSYFKMTKEIS